jgi:small subunit ribosomal protein SAe
MRYVDIAIPANNKGKHSIGALFWLLARMVLQMRGTVTPTRPWEIMVDLFFYREPDETKDRDDEEAAAPEFTSAEYVPPPALTGGDAADWTQGGQWEPEGPVVPPTAMPPAEAPADWTAAAPPAGWDPASMAPPAPAGFAPPASAPSGWEPAAAPSGWEPAQ